MTIPDPAALDYWHVIYIYLEDANDDDSTIHDIWHPEACGTSWDSRSGIRRECAVTHELESSGTEFLGPDLGLFWLHCQHVTISTPGAWSEMDLEVQMIPLADPMQTDGS